MNYTVMSKPAIQYLCSVINQVVSLPTDVINNINLADNLTFSNIHIKNLIDQCLIDANDYADQVVNALTHLVAEKIDFEPTLDNTTDKLNTLLLYSKNNDNNYTQYLRLTNELLNLGDTSLSLTDYLKITDAASTYTKLTDFKTLSDEVAGIKTKIGTETLTTTATTLTGAINELEGREGVIVMTKAEYTQLVASGSVTLASGETVNYDANGLYVISDDEDSVVVSTTINSASTNDEIPTSKAVYDAIKPKVADVVNKITDVSTLGISEISEGLIIVNIKNGWCQVIIQGLIINSTFSNTINIPASLPKPAYQYNWVAIFDYNSSNTSSGSSTNITFVKPTDNGALMVDFVTAKAGNYFTTFSYPVAES